MLNALKLQHKSQAFSINALEILNSYRCFLTVISLIFNPLKLLLIKKKSSKTGAFFLQKKMLGI